MQSETGGTLFLIGFVIVSIGYFSYVFFQEEH